MKKRNLNIFMVIIGITSLLVACFFAASRSDEYKEEGIAGDASVAYHDFSELQNVPAAVYKEYSYGTIFLSSNTQFIIEQRPGYQGYDWDSTNNTWVANSYSYETIPDDYISYFTVEGTNITMPHFIWFNTGTLRMRITNCATNKNGEMLDVIVEISDIKIWKDYLTPPPNYVNHEARFSLDFYPYNYYTFTDPNDPDRASGKDYDVPLQIGSPIMFWLNSNMADCNFKLSYVKPGTDVVDTTMDYIPGIWHDFDVPYGSVIGPNGDTSIENYKNTHVLFNGNEGVTFRGFSPTNASSTAIYYNKNESQYYKYGDNDAVSQISSSNSRFRAVLEPSSDGKGIYVYDNYDKWMGNDTSGWYIPTVQEARAIATDGIYYQTSIDTLTSNANGVLEFEYGGAGCGIGYIFGFAYPMNDSPPTKSVSSSGPFRLSDSYHYYLRQYIPNNYLATKVRFDQAQRVLSTSSNGESTPIFDDYKIHKGLVFEDTLDSHLTTTQSSIKVYRNNVGGDDVTNLFNISVTTTDSGNLKVTATTKDNVFDQSFYSHYYYLDIPVTINKYVDQNKTIGGEESTYIPNDGKTTIKYDNYADLDQLTNSVDVKVKYKVVSRHYKVNTSPNELSLHNPFLVSRTNEKICEDITIVDLANANDSFSTSPCSTAVASSSHWRFREILVKGMDKTNIGITPAVKAVWNSDGTGGANSSGAYSNTVQESLTYSDGVIYIDYYYEKKPAKVITNYLIDDANRDQVPGCSPNTQFTFESNSYSTTQCNPTGYDFSRMDPDKDPASGTVTRDTMIVTYLYRRKAATLVVKHLPSPAIGSNATAHADVTSTVYFGDTYSTNYLQPTELSTPYTNVYEWNGTTPSNDHGEVNASTVNSNNQIVVTYYYRPLSGTYVVYHYLQSTIGNDNPESVCDTETYEQFAYGTVRTTNRCSSAMTNYTQVSCDGSNTSPAISTNITINKPLTEVTYCYKPKTATIITNHYMQKSDGTLTTEKVHEPDTQTVNFGMNYDTHYYQSNELKDDRDNSFEYVFKNRYQWNQEVPTNKTGPVTAQTVNSDNQIIVNYYYKPIPARITVHHYKEGSEVEVCANPQSPIVDNEAYFDKSYSYSACQHLNDDKYYFKDSNDIYINTADSSYNIDNSTITGKVNQQEVVIIFTYRLKPATLTVHHYICSDNNDSTIKVHDDEVNNTMTYGQQYHVTDRNADLYDDNDHGHYRNRYEFNGRIVGDSKDGVITKDNTSVTFCYSPKPVIVYTHHIDKRDTSKKVHADDIETKYYGDEYTTTTYTPAQLGEGYTNRYSYTGEHTGDAISGTVYEVKSEYHIYYYYDLDSSDYIVHHKVCDTADVNNNNDVAPTTHTVGNQYTHPYTSVPIISSALETPYRNNYQYASVTTNDPNATVNNTTGVTTGTFSQDTVEITYCYVQKKATVTAHYYIDGTDTQVHADDVQENVGFGTVYHTPKYEPSDLAGDYKDNYIYSRMDETHDPATGNVGKDNIDVIYYYVRNPIILKTRHYIKGTNINVSSTCPDQNEEKDRRSTYEKVKCTSLPNGYVFDNVRSDQSSTVLNQAEGKASGTITTTTTIIFEYKLVGIGLTVEYYDIDTGQKITGIQDRFESKTYGDSVQERPINIENYEYIKTIIVAENNSNPDFSVTQNTGYVNGNIRENTTIKYYYRKVLDLYVHHYKKGTTESICDDEHNRLRFNTTYEKDPCTDETKLREYRFVAVTSTDTGTTINNMTGKATGEIKAPTTITYYYEIPSFVPETSKTGTESIDKRDDVVQYNLSYKGTIKNYVGNATVKLVDKLPYPLKDGDSRISLDGGTYDANARTITWEIPWNDINTTTGGDAIKIINKTVKVVYRDIPVTVTELNNKFDTTTELTGKTFKTEDEFTTDFNLYTLTVKHRMFGTTNEINGCPQEVKENLNYGYNYSTLPCQALGSEYTLKGIKEVVNNSEVDGGASGTITKDVTLIYYYDLTKYNLVIKHLDIDTNVELVETRNDRVPYGTTYDEGTITKNGYRFVELYVSDNEADKEEDHVSGTVTGNTEITFYYKKYLNLHIKHVDIDIPTIILDEETKEVPYRSEYEEHKKTFNKYEFVDVSSDDSETNIFEDKASGVIEKNINITYRYKKQLDLVTHHYKKGTTEEICPTENEVLPYNTAYEKNKCNNEDLLGDYIYAYVESNNPESTINDPLGKVTGNIKSDTDIIFYYELTTIDINPKKEGPTLLHSRSKAFNYKITDAVKIKDYRGDATITITDKLEYEIDMTRSNLAGGTYNNEDKTITWTIPWNNINTNGQPNDTVTKNVSIEFTIYYKNVPMEVEVITNRVVENVDTVKVDKENDTYIDTQIDPFTLIVHHYKEGTTQELCPTTTDILDEGTSYTKTICNLDEYDFIEVKKNGTRLNGNTGTVTENISGDTTLDFIYRKKDSTLETVVTKTGPDELTELYQEVTYDIHYEGHVIDYRGNGVITITDTLPYMIDTNRSNLDGGEYDGEYKIVWKVNWNDIDTYNGKNNTIKVDKKIKVVFLDVNIDRKIMTNEVEAKTVLDDKTDLVVATKDTDIKLPGTIIVHHYVHGTTDRLFDDDEATGLVHEKYHAQPNEREGYRVVTRPEDEDIEFTIGEQVLVYTYEKLKFDIKTEVLGGLGEITGDEEISYGNDSTVDYIVITPDEGYEIELVYVDGVAIEITDPDRMVLDNFKNVKENHLVQVLFSEKPIEVPITGRKTKLIITAVIAILLNIFIAVKTGFVSKILKKSL